MEIHGQGGCGVRYRVGTQARCRLPHVRKKNRDDSPHHSGHQIHPQQQVVEARVTAGRPDTTRGQ